MIRLLRYQINSDDRKHYIKINNALLRAVTILGNRFPEPTMENVQHPNSKRLIGIRNKYLEYEGNKRLANLVSAALRIVIAKIEHSPNYRDRFSWFVEELINSDWKSRSYNHPVNGWNEPKPYGRQL